MKIYAPNKQLEGLHGSLVFVHGIAETDDEHQLEWFGAHGYGIGEDIGTIEEVDTSVPAPENAMITNTEKTYYGCPISTLLDMTTVELKQFAKANGVKVANSYKDKEKVLQIIYDSVKE